MKKIILQLVVLLPFSFAVGQNMGIGNASPSQKLVVNGKIKIGNDAATAEEGTIRWNNTTKDFEGFTGTGWVSLTKAGVPVMGAGSAGPVNNYKPVFPGDINEDKEFGFSVDIDTNYAIIGAPISNTIPGARSGAAYIFIKQANGNWQQQAKLLPDGTDNRGIFGYRVSISGEYAAVSDFINPDIVSTDIAQVYIFKRAGTAWAKQTVLNEVASTAGSITNRTGFGYSIDIDTVHLVVGAPRRNQQLGDAFVYQRSGTTWSSPVTLTHQTTNAGATLHFGNSVSLYKNEVIVGSPNEADYTPPPANQLTTVVGRLYLYRKQSGVWNKIFDIMPGSYGNDPNNPTPLQTKFGEHVTLYDRYMIVSAPLDGSVFIYASDGTDEFRLSYPDVKSVSMYGNKALVLTSTKVYVHKRTGSAWNLYAYFPDPDGGLLASASIWGNEIITGVPSFLRCSGVNCFNSGKAFFVTVE